MKSKKFTIVVETKFNIEGHSLFVFSFRSKKEAKNFLAVCKAYKIKIHEASEK